jgi:hypothetical protein
MIGMNICPQFFLFYKTTFKVGTNHIPFQFVYGLHPLLPMEYLLPSKPG